MRIVYPGSLLVVTTLGIIGCDAPAPPATTRPAATRPVDAEPVEAKVIAVVAKLFGRTRASITRATHIENDLGGNDLDTVELVMALEDAFKLIVPEEQQNAAKTVGDYVDLIEQLKAR